MRFALIDDIESSKPKIHRFYLLDGEPCPRAVILERIEEEIILLMRAEVTFHSAILYDENEVVVR